MSQRPETPNIPPESNEGGSSRRHISSVRPTRPRPRPEFESRRVRRVTETAETVPWYNNTRLLIPIAAVVIAGVVLLGIAVGVWSGRQAAAPTAPAPVIQVTAGAPGQSIPVEVVTSTPAPAGGATAAPPAGGATSAPPAATAVPKGTP